MISLVCAADGSSVEPATSPVAGVGPAAPGQQQLGPAEARRY